MEHKIFIESYFFKMLSQIIYITFDAHLVHIYTGTTF